MGDDGLNEVEAIELFLILTLPETNIGGLINIGWYLVSNLVGATVVCCLISTRHGGARHA
jgi:hypothetical protein